jgi:hypothetical protein
MRRDEFCKSRMLPYVVATPYADEHKAHQQTGE